MVESNPPKNITEVVDPSQKAFNSLLKLFAPLKENPKLMALGHKEATDFIKSPLFKNMFKEKIAHYREEKEKKETNHPFDPFEEATFQTLAIIYTHAQLALSGGKSRYFQWQTNKQVEQILDKTKKITVYLREIISPQDKSQLLG